MSPARYELRQEFRGGFALRTLRATIDNLPRELSGYRIAQLTDFHLGPATTIEHLEDAVRIVKELAPDLILLTGDYVQYTRFSINHTLGSRVHPKVFGWTNYRRKVRGYASDIGALMKRVEARDGIFGVFGNHDHHEGIGSIQRQIGRSVQWLNNAQAVVGPGERRLLVAGIDDIQRGKPDLPAALLDIDRHNAAFRILLSHNPDITMHTSAGEIAKVDLMLCGHTHGGQIRIPGWGPLVTRTKQKEHVIGLSHFGKTAIYISAGVGYGAIGLRLFCPPEITLIELVSSEPKEQQP